MAKPSTIIVASALCFLSFFGSALCVDRFFIEGTVYCDTCRLQFITKVSEFISGATVRLECKEIESGNVTFSKEAVTDATGTYSLEVDGDHEEEVCEVVLVKSSRADCGDIEEETHHGQQAARISLTNNNGIVSPIRIANPLGFLKKQPLPVCTQVINELGPLDDDGNLA